MKNRSVVLFTLLFATCVAVSSLNSYTATYVSAAPHPQGSFAPPSYWIGSSNPMNLTESMNAWRANATVKANNTLQTCQGTYRVATAFVNNPPSGFILGWQNLSVSKLTAAPDFREVQYASSTSSYLIARKTPTTGQWQRLAMRFNLPDDVNLTSVSMYYFANATSALLQVVSTGSGTESPQGKIVGNITLPQQLSSPKWTEVKFTKPLNLTRGYYWLVVNATLIPDNQVIKWGYVGDPGGVPDQRLASAYSISWFNEASLHSGSGVPYLNLMLVLKALPVVSGNVSQVMTYSSPAQVNMLLIGGTPILQNETRVSTSIHKFTLGTNTSVTFVGNWTAGFYKLQTNYVKTFYAAQLGLTNWIANFTSEGRPSNRYTWYNRTLTVTSIPPYWQIDPFANVTNDKGDGFFASYVFGSGIITLLQTDDVNGTLYSWDATWTIFAASLYSISSSIPSTTIMGQRFNIGIARNAPLTSTHINLTVYDSSDSVVSRRNVAFPLASPLSFPFRLNQTGSFTITLLDKADHTSEVSYLVMATNVTAALTSLNLQNSRLNATFGDVVNITFRYRNTTLGSDKEFGGTPNVVVRVANHNFTISTVQANGGGWFWFNFETSRLNSSGGYGLTIIVSYTGTYVNQKSMALQLNPQGVPALAIVFAGGGSAGAVIAVLALLRYRTGRRVKEEKKVKILRQTVSLARLVVVHLGNGLAAYSRNLGTEETVDPNLISGFLSANQSIMSEVFKGKAPSGLRFADYGEYKVVSYVGKYVMSALFCTEAAGEELQSILEEFTKEFEKNYEKELTEWHGDVDILKGADSIADRVFSLRLISPYVLELNRLVKVRLSGIERAVVDNARRLTAVRGVFFMPRIIDFLITNKKAKRSKIIDIIDSLVQKGVFKQLTLDEAALIISQTEPDSKSINDETSGAQTSDE